MDGPLAAVLALKLVCRLYHNSAFPICTLSLELTAVYRSLADVDNRGKLNLPEFYVAMGLIYRRMLFYLTSK